MREIQLGKRLIDRRHKAGISQEELAKYMGVSKAAVSKWENEQSYPDILFLPQLAAYFNISIDELMGYEPQLTKEEIRRHYFRFARAFETGSFEKVMGECKDEIKKYYSCYPFLLQMAVLLLNHAQMAANPTEVLEYALTLLKKIKLESDDANDVKEATAIEATCYLILNRPEEALDILDENVRPIPQDTEILAQTYQRMGNVEKAREVSQIAMYQHLLMLVGDSSFYLTLCQTDMKKVEMIIERTDKIVEAYQLDYLHPNVMAAYYITCAQVYCMNGKEDEAIAKLQGYVKLCTTSFFPFTLHGDDCFDKMDWWFAEFELGNQAPRGEKLIKESMVSSMCDNPCFQNLKERKEFLEMESKLRKLNLRN